MKLITFALGCVGAATMACATNPAVSTSSGDVGSAVPVNARRMPAGTTIDATLNDAIGTKRSHVGDSFTATVTQPVVAQNGATVVPAGATIRGHVTGLHSPNAIGQQSAIRLDFDSIDLNGQSYPFDASISSVDVKSTLGSSGATRGAITGAAAGAVLGAIVSGAELSKIIEGGLLGAAAGTVISLGTGEGEGTIPSGSHMQLRSTKAVVLR